MALHYLSCFELLVTKLASFNSVIHLDLRIVAFLEIFDFGTRYDPRWSKHSVSSFDDLSKRKSLASALIAKTLVMFAEFFRFLITEQKIITPCEYFHFFR